MNRDRLMVQPGSLDHDDLWRCSKALPERGRIGIFNRPYCEEVLVARVYPVILEKQNLPPEPKKKDIWQRRLKEINAFEQYLVHNGIVVLKFFLNVSRDEQKRRFLERINQPEKNWKFAAGDVRERGFWHDYRNAYEDVFNHTSTNCAPCYIVPADNKWFTRLAAADIICNTLKDLKLAYPTVSETHRQELLKAKQLLENEDRSA